MATREQLAARLGIPASQVNPRGLVDHAFPGVADCLPQGVVRDRFVERVGGDLLEGGLADSDAPGDDVGYNNALARARQVLDMPEVRDALARCRAGGVQPGPQPPGGAGGPGVGCVLLALLGAAGAVWLLWWLHQKNSAAAAPPAQQRGMQRGSR